jgi:hypothetical protein
LDIDGDGSARDSAAKVGHHNDGIALVLHNKSLRSALEKASLAGVGHPSKRAWPGAVLLMQLLSRILALFRECPARHQAPLWHTGPGNRGRLAGGTRRPDRYLLRGGGG